jgi:hypothetical protein
MDVGVRAKQDARAELATWQECYREVAYTEARDLITFDRWPQHCLEIATLTLAKTVFCLSKCHSSKTPVILALEVLVEIKPDIKVYEFNFNA